MNYCIIRTMSFVCLSVRCLTQERNIIERWGLVGPMEDSMERKLEQGKKNNVQDCVKITDFQAMICGFRLSQKA